MEIRTAPELGIKHPASMRPLKQEPPAENPAALPGVDTSNRQSSEEARAASALRPMEAQKTYEVAGAMIDVKA